jgi:hypothetical protein
MKYILAMIPPCLRTLPAQAQSRTGGNLPPDFYRISFASNRTATRRVHRLAFKTSKSCWCTI